MSNSPIVVVGAQDSYGTMAVAEEMQGDPILAPSLPTSPSRSRARNCLITSIEGESAGLLTGAMENEPLLGERSNERRKKKPFYRARPMWIVPFAILAAIGRGMTLAPRVEVFTQLACQLVLGNDINFNHTDSRHHSLQRSEPNSQLSTIIRHTDSYITFDSSIQSEDGDNDRAHERCTLNPRVQSVAARLQTTVVIVMGVVSTLTTGWWGHFGERHGRTKVMAIGALGMLITDFTFAAISIPNTLFARHGHVLLVIAPFFEGLLGGWSSLQGATSAYISDCTSDGSRSHIFSRFMGVFFFGFALGPVLGAWVIRNSDMFFNRILHTEIKTDRTVVPVFVFAVTFWTISILLSAFVFPESLGKKMLSKDEVGVRVNAEIITTGEVTAPKTFGLKTLLPAALRNVFMPLVAFAPRKHQVGKGKDWSMTLLALALFGYLLSSGIYQLKYLYAEHVFDWDAEQLSYYITLVGGARAVNLLFVMPFIITTFKPKPKMTSKQQESISAGKKPKPTRSQLIVEMKFDLIVTRISFVLDIISHTLVSFSSTSPTSAAQIAFAGFTVLSSFGSGAYPSIQSLALCIQQAYAEDEDQKKGAGAETDKMGTGSLFGALAVIQAAGQMILGPLLFGLVYSTTVATFPKGIFVLAGSILLVSVILLAGVSPRRAIGGVKRKRTTMGPHTNDDRDAERGRSRVSKDLRSNIVGPSSSNYFGNSDAETTRELAAKPNAAVPRLHI